MNSISCTSAAMGHFINCFENRIEINSILVGLEMQARKQQASMLEHTDEAPTSRRTETQSTTGRMNAQRPRTRRLAQVRCYESHSRLLHVIVESKSKYSFQELAENESSSAVVGTDKPRSESRHGPEIRKNGKYLNVQDTKLRGRGNEKMASGYQPRRKAPDIWHDEGKETHKMVAINGLSSIQRKELAHQRMIKIADNTCTVKFPPIIQKSVRPSLPPIQQPAAVNTVLSSLPPIQQRTVHTMLSASYSVKTDQHGNQVVIRGRRVGQQEICEERGQQRRRQGVSDSVLSDNAQAERTFIRVLNKRF